MRRNIVIAITCVLFSFPALAYAASPAWVTVHDTGLIWGEDILLGSIADISCADGQRLQELINMKLGNIVKPGGVKPLTAYVLKMKIQSSGVDSSNITWSIPDNITITRASQTVPSTQINAAAQAEMEQAVKASGEQRNWTIELLTGAADMVIPPGELKMETEIPYGIKYTVPTVVYVHFNVKGKDAGRAVCRFQLHTFDNVVVAARAVRANTVLTADDVRIEKKEISSVTAYYMTDINIAIGQIPRYPLKPGDILKESLLVSPVIVKRGAPVHIMVKTNGLTVQTDGVAMTDGSKDEVIRVKNSTTGVIVSGQVIDENTVAIQMDS